MRTFLLSGVKEDDRMKALDELQAIHKSHFESMFRRLKGHPFTMALLDTSLLAFLPPDDDAVKALAERIHMDQDKCLRQVRLLRLAGMMSPTGHFHGYRLCFVCPELVAMQTAALIGAALTVQNEGMATTPKILIPRLCAEREIEYVTPVVRHAAKKIFDTCNGTVDYSVGVMVEVSRDCIRADALAGEDVDFVVFNTDTLTESAFGLCAHGHGPQTFPAPASSLPTTCVPSPKDPFSVLDEKGVGQMIFSAIKDFRRIRPSLQLGVTGRHCGDPSSISFFDKISINYLSCAKEHIHTAKLVAAQAHIEGVSRDMERRLEAELEGLMDRVRYM